MAIIAKINTGTDKAKGVLTFKLSWIAGFPFPSSLAFLIYRPIVLFILLVASPQNKTTFETLAFDSARNTQNENVTDTYSKTRWNKKNAANNVLESHMQAKDAKYEIIWNYFNFGTGPEPMGHIV